MNKKVVVNNKRKASVNEGIITIFKGYFDVSAPKELFFDILIPFIIALTTFLLLGFFSSSNTLLFVSFTELNSASINVMAILAGFNTAALAVIASSNIKTLKNLFKVNTEKENISSVIFDDMNIFKRLKYRIYKVNDENILKVTILFFSYAISLQLIVLIIGSFFVVIAKNIIDVHNNVNLLNSITIRVVITSIGVLWFSFILHCLFVTLRNVSLIYKYILFLGKEKSDD